MDKMIELIEGTFIVKLLKHIGLSVYPLVAKTDSKSFIIYQRIGLEPYSLSGRGIGAIESYYAIKVVTPVYSDGLSITKQLINILADYKSQDVSDISITDLSEEYIDSDYIQTIKLKLTL